MSYLYIRGRYTNIAFVSIFDTFGTPYLHLLLAQLPRSQDLAIFLSIMTTTTTQPIALPLGHAHGGKICSFIIHIGHFDRKWSDLIGRATFLSLEQLVLHNVTRP